MAKKSDGRNPVLKSRVPRPLREAVLAKAKREGLRPAGAVRVALTQWATR